MAKTYKKRHRRFFFVPEQNRNIYWSQLNDSA
ncbi:hypothetical protein D9981_06490 [Pseudoalteromonas phenolica O-BC30]|nr:hypothetical protein D9981_06490 [Pseudoalteromonas phenolica O-BC30]